MSAAHLAREHGGCAQAILVVFMDEFGIEDQEVFRGASAMHAGMLVSGTCGIFSAGMMVLGLLMGRGRIEEGRDGLAPVVFPAQSLFCGLRTVLGSDSCLTLSGCDFRDPEAARSFAATGANRRCHELVQMGAEAIAHGLQEMVTLEEVYAP